MIAQFPPAIVVIPLMASALCALLRKGGVCWAVAVAVCAITAVETALELGQVRDGGVISYALGGWAPPWGIEYRIDLLAAYILLLVAVIGTIVLIYGRKSVKNAIKPELQGWYYAMYLLCFAGLLGITITGDAFNAFVFLEVSSLSTYVLIALGRDRRALAAAFQYLILGTIGATLYVIGIGFIYTVTGTLNMVDMAVELEGQLRTPPVLTGLAFIITGISLKIALFPLHLWLPNAYAYAPSVTTAFLSATATKVSIYLLMRFLYTVFGFDFAVAGSPVPAVLLLMSLAAIFAGSIVAMFQNNVKRMLAYSSVAQIGYITLGIALANATGLTGSLVHIFNHAVMKGGLFMLIGGIAMQIGTVRLSDMAGLGRQMPLTMAGFVIAAASMLGIPGTVGFVSKWYLAIGALENDQWWLVMLLMLSSLMVVVYMGRVIEAAYFKPRPAGAPVLADPPPSMILMSWVMIIACVVLGVYTDLTVGVAGDAAAALIGSVAQ